MLIWTVFNMQEDRQTFEGTFSNCRKANEYVKHCKADPKSKGDYRVSMETLDFKLTEKRKA